MGSPSMDKNIPNKNIENEVLTMVGTEYRNWRDATVFVTTKVAFNIRALIESLRKNYYGIFDEPTDRTTGEKKIFIPLTESSVDSIVKNIDLDTKDINIRAKRAKAVGLSSFVRSVVRDRLSEMGFGQLLDESERFLGIDGTFIWKTFRVGKKVKVKRVDLLNFFIEGTANSIQESPCIERAIMTVPEVQAMDGWWNTDGLEGRDVSPNDDALNGMRGGVSTKGDSVEVFERWGLIPRYYITGNKEDTDLVEGHIVVSGSNMEMNRVHLIEENTEKDADGNIIKPYEECWYMKAPNRWHGRGPAEKLMMLQIYLNTIVNIRISRARVSQLGIFKVRNGSKITPQMLSRLTTNGVISVNSMDDIEQMIVQEASQASYKDEDVINSWAGRVTSAFESVTGEQLPSSTPATNAVIQNRMAQSQFVMVREGIGMFLQRWLRRHYLPKLAETLTKGEVVRIYGEIDEIRDLNKTLANGLVKKQVDKMMADGQVPPPQLVERERTRVMEKLAKNGPEHFVEIMKKPDMSLYDVSVEVTNEEMDKAVLVQNLIQAMSIAAQIPESGINMPDIIRQVFDLMGLDSSSIKDVPTAPQNQPQPAVTPSQENASTPKEAQTLQQLTTSANTL